MRAMSRLMTTAPGPPEINQPVRLEIPDLDQELPSRLEDLARVTVGRRRTGYRLSVAAPSFDGSLGWEREGAPVQLRWVTGRGVCFLPCTFEERIVGKPSLWVLRSVAAVELEQRRDYVRADVFAPARLGLWPAEDDEVADGDEAADSGHDADPGTAEPASGGPANRDVHWRGSGPRSAGWRGSGSPLGEPRWSPAQLVELSEQGARLSVAAAVELDVDGGEPAVVELELSEVLRVPATVLRTQPAPPARLVIVSLAPDDDAATVIRRAVLEAQIEARRLSGQ